MEKFLMCVYKLLCQNMSYDSREKYKMSSRTLLYLEDNYE